MFKSVKYWKLSHENRLVLVWSIPNDSALIPINNYNNPKSILRHLYLPDREQTAIHDNTEVIKSRKPIPSDIKL